MTRKMRRLSIVLACGAGLGSASALTLSAFSDNLVFFMSPGDIAHKAPAVGRTIRLGGLVQARSLHVEKQDGEPVAAFRRHRRPDHHPGQLRRASCRTCFARVRAS